MRRLRRWVWGEYITIVLMVFSLTALYLPRPFQMLAGLFPILLLVATLQGFIGIFIAGATFDRKGLHRNQSLRKYTWIGMILSILMFCSVVITFGFIFLIAAIFG